MHCLNITGNVPVVSGVAASYSFKNTDFSLNYKRSLLVSGAMTFTTCWVPL